MTSPSSPSTLEDIENALSRMSKCPGFSGVVLASADGLVLASYGELIGDAAAACAASLALDSTSALGAVGGLAPNELMAWADTKVWYQTSLPTTHLLLAVSDDQMHAGALRAAVRRELDTLATALGTL